MSTAALDAGSAATQAGTPPAGENLTTGQGIGSTGPATASPNLSPAGSASVAPWHNEWLRTDGTLNHDVYARLPDSLKHMKDSLVRYNTAEALLGVLDEKSKLAGRKALAPLPDNAPPELKAERDQLLRQINGVPDKPDGYGISKPKDLPDGAWNNDLAAQSSAVMHKYNAPPAMVRELVALQVKTAQENLAAQDSYTAKFFADHEANLQAELRQSNVAWEKGQELILRGANLWGIPENDPVLKNSRVALAMIRSAQAVGEDKWVSGQTNSAAPTDSHALAGDIAHNKANPDYSAYWNSSDPRNKEVKAKVESLYREAEGRLARSSAAQGNVRR